VPRFERYVTDLAGLLSVEEASTLEAELAGFERETSHQLALLTVPSLEGEAVEAYALRVAESWQLGDAEADNGVLVLVASRDRRVRIEVGYGLEGVLPDALGARIIREHIVPAFREGAMSRGVRAGLTAVMSALRGEVVAPGPGRSERRSSGGASVEAVLFGVVFGAALGGVLGRKRRALGASLGAVAAGGITFVFTRLLALAGLAAVFAAMLGMVRASGGGPWIGSGGGYRGGFGGGGFGGGGFGGGGGGFGGGGASGSW